jgi:prolyl-tRNA editing enzyme YbaK/EbsC (Cys-tRNA(Pro) deacylase)
MVLSTNILNMRQFGLQVYMDPGLYEHTEILFNCGDRKATIIMNTHDYVSVVKPKELVVSKL